MHMNDEHRRVVAARFGLAGHVVPVEVIKRARNVTAGCVLRVRVLASRCLVLHDVNYSAGCYAGVSTE